MAIFCIPWHTSATDSRPRGFAPFSFFSCCPQERPRPGRLLVVHGGDDEYCRLGDVEQFVGALRAKRARLVVVPDAPHFFPFYMRSGQQQLRDAIGAALAAWGWIPQSGAQRLAEVIAGVIESRAADVYTATGSSARVAAYYAGLGG